MTEHFDDAGRLVLLLFVGGLLLLHGIHKIVTGPAGIDDMIAAAGFPAFLGWAVYLGEILGPILILLGVCTRLGGLLVFINMVVAVLLVHSGDVLALNSHGGWFIELEACYGLGALAVICLGAGRYSLGGVYGRWN
jgi:putative oxidoreductase